MKELKTKPTHYPKPKPTPPQSLATFDMVYKVKGCNTPHHYTFITFTKRSKRLLLWLKTKKHFKSLFKDLGCKLLSFKLTSLISTKYRDSDPTRYNAKSSKHI